MKDTMLRVTELMGDGKLLCAETVLTIIAEAGGRDPAEMIRLATPFCSGVARTKGQCGALSGAIMGIGLFAGRTEPGGDFESTYALTQKLVARFVEQCGSVNCYDLIQCDFRTPEGRQRYKENDLRLDCLRFVAVAAEIAMALLRESGSLPPSREEHMKSRLAPCGLSCGHCLAYAEGPIREAASRLVDGLGPNFAAYAERFEGMNPIFKKYGEFSQFLEFLSKGSCQGCREKGCLFEACKIPECVREQGVDYCFQCGEFPCDRHGMPAGLATRWQTNNETMAKIGVEAWFNGCNERPRYP